MSKNTYIIDVIIAAPGNEPISAASRMGYDRTRLAADLTDNEFASVGMINSVISALIYVIPAGTSIPYFIDISSYTGKTINSQIITKATSYDPSTGAATGRLQRWYDMLVEDQDSNNNGTGTFTGWNIYGHDDGSGNFKENTTIIIL